MLKMLAFVLFMAGFAAAQEVHNGITYEVRWDNTSSISTTPIKEAYETEAAKQATAHLQKALITTGITPNCLNAINGSTPADLYALKDCIAADSVDNFFVLLASDIYNSAYFWEKIVSESTTDRTQWKPARVYVRGYFGAALSAAQFALWTQSSQADTANSHANPEHYYKSTQITGPTNQSSHILEGWGGVLSTFGTKRTNFTVPDYSIPDFGSTDFPEAWSISTDFNLQLQRAGPKVIDSYPETTFGVMHIAVRDVAANETDNHMNMAGVEVYAAVWYPPWDQAVSAEDRQEFQTNYLSDEAHHMVVEIINLTLQALLEQGT